MSKTSQRDAFGEVLARAASAIAAQPLAPCAFVALGVARLPARDLVVGALASHCAHMVPEVAGRRHLIADQLRLALAARNLATSDVFRGHAIAS